MAVHPVGQRFLSGVTPPPSRTSRPAAVWNTVVRLSGIRPTLPSSFRCLRRRVVAAVVVLAVLAVPAGFGIYTWRQAGALETAISYGQYGRAQAVYRRAPWLSMLDEQQAAYVDAQVLMEQGELEQARQAFLVLEGYQDSEELAENIRLYLIAVDHPKSLGALKQYEYFIELGDFLDSHSRALECLPGIAEEGVSWFEDWRFESTLVRRLSEGQGVC